ncbi:MAG: hypothetical protein GXY52_00005 [Chloroflexi bacterium]|nr:hypothetical protein [Chloroflexota bacterium]
MDNKEYMTWVRFYTEFATKLLAYKTDRKTLIARLQSVYKSIDINFPKVDSSDSIADMDPFTVFGLFTRREVVISSNANTILQGIAKEFSISARVPDSFDGIPVLNNRSPTFYRFVGDPDRGEHDIDNLWKVFEAAISYADNETQASREAFIKAYDLVKDLKGNCWKLTMGLFWIRPFKFVNLDSRNRWFIKVRANMPSDCIDMIKGLDNLPDGRTYDLICVAFVNAIKGGAYRYSNLPELSYFAWTVSEKVNQEQKATESQVKQVNTGAAIADDNVDTVSYWIYSPGVGARMWEEFYKEGIVAIGWGDIGDLSDYSSKDEMKTRMKECYGTEYSYMNIAHATWQFANEMKPGDIVFAKKGKSQMLGRGVVTSEYKFDTTRSDIKTSGRSTGRVKVNGLI